MRTFLATHSHVTGAVYPAAEADGMPAELRDALGRIGRASLANGFFRFIVPSEFRELCSLFDLDPVTSYPFLACAFGHLTVFESGAYKLIDPVHGTVDVLGREGSLDFVLDVVMTDRPSLESTFLLDLYEQALPRLGPPGADEIYALVPPLKLGGARAATNVKRSRAAVELRILSSL